MTQKQTFWLFHLFVVLIFNQYGFSQSFIGQPFIDNFPKSIYNAGTQNWDIDQSDNGTMFFANNDGLLEFNGSEWQIHKLPKQTICRSVLCDSNRVYVGGQSELGYFKTNFKGLLVYKPISFDLSQNITLTDIWKIAKKGNYIFFYTNEGVVKFNSINEESIFYAKDINLMFFAEYEEGFLIQSLDSGLFYFSGDSFEPLRFSKSLKNVNISGLIKLDKSSYLIISQKNGFYKLIDDSVFSWKTNLDQLLKESIAYKAISSGGDIIISSSQAGLFILDADGNLKLHLDKPKGLQNNNVLVSFIDLDKNLWLGLDNGIDYVEINSPFKSFYPDKSLEGTSYAALEWKNRIFAGTNNGLFYCDLQGPKISFGDGDFKSFQGFKGQVWGLNSTSDELFINHHEGLFVIKDTSITKLGSHNGSWLIMPSKKDTNLFFEGTYEGINVYQKEHDSLKFVNKIKGFNESSRFVCQTKDGYFWIAHPYKGIFKCYPDKDYKSFVEVKRYDSTNGFPSDIMLKVFEINNQIYFTSEFEVYYYDEDVDSFKVDLGISKLFSERPQIRYLAQGKGESIWFVNDDEVGLFDIKYEGIEQKITKKVMNSISGQLVNGFEFIKQISDGFSVLGAEKGMILYNNYFQEKTKPQYKIQISSIEIFGEKDSVLFTRFLGEKQKAITSLQSNYNNLSFTFSTPIFVGNSTIEYSYFLVGFDEQWSSWSQTPNKDYTNLPPKKYSFLVKSRVPNFMETEPVKFYFQITPPWYKSKYAYISYVLLILGLMFGVVVYQRTKYENEKNLIKKQQERKLMQKTIEHKNFVELNENEIMKLKNERLQDEINFKTKELASSTMHLVQKTEILSKIKSDLKKTSDKLENRDFVNNQIKSVIKLINENVRLDKNWDQFEIQFDQVHVEFNKKLKEKYPELTPNDLKICAYLRMNLTTKEISPLMNISVRGVEISRYRLRKKLNLDRDVNLYNFLAEI